MIASGLFTWIQGASFYQEVHRAAVELLPKGDGRDWIDVGCGPGLVSRLAADRGYRTVGVDMSPQMIRAARRLAAGTGSTASFQIGSVFELRPESADVTSAASLLAVLEEKARAIATLWETVRPGGTLLIIEPTEHMNLENARAALEHGLLPPKRARGILLWARARQGRAIPADLLKAVRARTIVCAPMLQGMVNAWLFHK